MVALYFSVDFSKLSELGDVKKKKKLRQSFIKWKNTNIIEKSPETRRISLKISFGVWDVFELFFLVNGNVDK